MTFLGHQNSKCWLVCILQVVLKLIIGGLMLMITGHVGIEFNGAKAFKGQMPAMVEAYMDTCYEGGRYWGAVPNTSSRRYTRQNRFNRSWYIS